MENNQITLTVKKICGQHCVGIDDGDKLFKKILPELKTEKKVCLSFEDILTLTSSFLNAAIGKLFGEIDNEKLDELLSWSGLDENDKQLVELVIKNAKEHFKQSKETRKAEDNIINNNIEED